jgi:hypothetical protein
MRPAASGEAFALEIPFLAYSPAADGAHRQNKVARLSRRQSKTDYYAVLGRKTRSFAPEIMSAQRLIRSSQRGWNNSRS